MNPVAEERHVRHCCSVARPSPNLSKVLDCLLGREVSAVYTKNELVTLINLNVEDPERQKESGLTTEDGNLLRGALTYRQLTVEKARVGWHRSQRRGVSSQDLFSEPLSA